MNTEQIKPARKHITPSFAKWVPPARFLRQSPREHRGIPFVEDKDYIKADAFDKAMAVVLGVAVWVVLTVTAYEWGWLR